MTELALTRIVSVVMYYHFAFLAISIALFGVGASGVFVYVMRRRLDRHATDDLLAIHWPAWPRSLLQHNINTTSSLRLKNNRTSFLGLTMLIW